MEFMDLKFDPSQGIIYGESTCGQQVSGSVKKNGKFGFRMRDEDFNVRYCWGRISKNRKQIIGTWGWENGEAEDQFKLNVVEEPESEYDEEAEEFEPSEADDNFGAKQ